MSEVGLVPFARVALEVSREVVPAYGHRFSPQRFTQPQLLAVLCLMRYEDWTFRAAEVRLAARFSFVGVSSVAVLRCHGVIGSNGFWLSIRVCA